MMVNEPLENLYFNWLCGKVIKNQNPTPSLTYWRLFRTLQNTEFVWIVPNDDNRVEDGLELRVEFMIQADIPDQPEWRRNPGCSVLEMLVAFSRRAEFATTGIPAKEWFWEFLRNLRLAKLNDAVFTEIEDQKVANILDVFIWRTYGFGGGRGGMFPLKKPKEDQRNVEIWYQFCQYLVDQDRLP